MLNEFLEPKMRYYLIAYNTPKDIPHFDAFQTPDNTSVVNYSVIKSDTLNFLSQSHTQRKSGKSFDFYHRNPIHLVLALLY